MHPLTKTHKDKKMKDRIKQLMEAQHMTQASFAQVLGINPATLSQILTGKANPSLNHVEAIHKGFPNISYPWLLHGEGPMFNISPTPPSGNSEQTLFTEDGQSNLQSTAPAPTYKKEKKQQAPLYEPVPSKFEIHKPVEQTERKIKEIVIYYSNNTFETFVPKA